MKKKTNEGCNQCTHWKFVNKHNTDRKYCCHKDSFKTKINPVSGEFRELKNNNIHKRWNKKLMCKRFEGMTNENNNKN